MAYPEESVPAGEYRNLLQAMRFSDPDSHFEYLRMIKEMFGSIFQNIIGNSYC